MVVALATAPQLRALQPHSVPARMCFGPASSMPSSPELRTSSAPVRHIRPRETPHGFRPRNCGAAADKRLFITGRRRRINAAKHRQFCGAVARATRIGVLNLQPGSQPKVRSGSGDVVFAHKAQAETRSSPKSNDERRIIARRPGQNHFSMSAENSNTRVYFQNVRLLLAVAKPRQDGRSASDGSNRPVGHG